jgi:hypothetical protein
MEPNSREVDSLVKGTEDLKAAVDELVHFCDTARDTLEVGFEGHTIKLPRIDLGRVLIQAVETQRSEIKNQYAYRGSSGSLHQEANALFDIADQVIAQFERISDVLDTWSRSEHATPDQIAQIHKDQIQHRMGDMMRVLKHFANKVELTEEDVSTLSNIDFTKPLTPQLGFDPDNV